MALKFRTKLALAMGSLAILSAGVSVAIVVLQSHDLLLQEMRSKALSIATTAAAMSDGDAHAAVQRSPDAESTPAYRRLVKQLRGVRDANRRDDVHSAYVYTLHPASDGVTVFGVDAEEALANRSRPGDVYKRLDRPSRLNLQSPVVVDEIVVDQWGEWLTAEAPIHNARGEPVAVLGVDIRASDVRARTHLLFLYGGAGVTVSILIAVATAIYLSRRISAPLARIKRAIDRISQGDLSAHVTPEGEGEVARVAHAVNAMCRSLQERVTLKDAFSRYVSPEVADAILKKGGWEAVGTERKKVTVLFSDLRDFSALSERRSPEEVVRVLNEHFTHMVEIVHRYAGTLDKFMGDGLMAVFGSLVDDPYQEEHAVRAALEMQEKFRELGREWKREFGTEFRMGIGIASGYAVVGNIGSARRLDFTAVGDTVNLAARIEAKTKELDAAILVSGYTLSPLGGLFETEPKGAISIRGREQKVTLHAVKGLASGRSAEPSVA